MENEYMNTNYQENESIVVDNIEPIEENQQEVVENTYYMDDEDYEVGVVESSALKIRDEPNGNELAIVRKGQVVLVIGEVDDWYNVNVTTSEKTIDNGFCMKEFIKLI